MNAKSSQELNAYTYTYVCMHVEGWIWLKSTQWKLICEDRERTQTRGGSRLLFSIGTENFPLNFAATNEQRLENLFSGTRGRVIFAGRDAKTNHSQYLGGLKWIWPWADLVFVLIVSLRGIELIGAAPADDLQVWAPRDTSAAIVNNGEHLPSLPYLSTRSPPPRKQHLCVCVCMCVCTFVSMMDIRMCAVGFRNENNVEVFANQFIQVGVFGYGASVKGDFRELVGYEDVWFAEIFIWKTSFEKTFVFLMEIVFVTVESFGV